MTCGGCVARVEQALRGVAGVRTATVQLMTESATVRLDDGHAPADGLVAAVRATGYDAEIIPADHAAGLGPSGDRHERERLRRHRQALIQALGLGLPVLVIEHLRHVFWPPTPESQMAARLMQTVLIVMMAISPAGAPILVGGLRALWHRSANMDLLITMGFSAAVVSSGYGTFVARREEFIHLHAAAMILGLVCVGRYLEARAKGRASSAMAALAKRVPKTALVHRAGRLVTVPVDEIAVGEMVSVPEHAAVPADGEVLEGAAAIDESLMTGEPMPVRRGPGQRVVAGSLVLDGTVVIRVTTAGRQSSLGRVVQLVGDAQASRTRVQQVADQVAGMFTPLVIAIAALVFASRLVLGGAASAAAAAETAIAVLVVACPCALGLATPTVVVVASGLAALRGILVRDAAMLEALGRVDVIAWDKTGTLTAGAPAVQDVKTLAGIERRSLLRLAAGALQLSPHPIAKAVVSQARREGVEIPSASGFQSSPGAGVSAIVEGRRVAIGSVSFLRGEGVPTGALEAALGDRSETTAAIALDGSPAGIAFLSDTIRPSTAAAIRRASVLGIRSEMLTGDSRRAAEVVAALAGITSLKAAVDAAGKKGRIEALKASGAKVAMVGDGVNDAAALAAADVGIAFATGADVACETAGINLIGSTPHLVVDAVELARASLRTIRQNVFWAFAYNVMMIPAAAVGMLPPEFAAGAMMASSLTVVLNALYLSRRWKAARPSMTESGRDGCPPTALRGDE